MKENRSSVAEFFRNKWVRLIIILDIIAIIVVVIFTVFNVMKTSVLYFNITPLDATISVNGDSNYANGSYRMLPGDYEIAISHEGMTTKTFNVELGGDSIVNIVTYLAGEDGGFEFYELRDNYSSYVELAGIASAENNVTTDGDTSAEEFVAEMEERLSLMDKLPLVRQIPHLLSNGARHIDRILVENGVEMLEDGCTSILCLYADYYDDGAIDDYKQAVKDLIIEAGYNPIDYEIIYPGEQDA